MLSKETNNTNRESVSEKISRKLEEHSSRGLEVSATQSTRNSFEELERLTSEIDSIENSLNLSDSLQKTGNTLVEHASPTKLQLISDNSDDKDLKEAVLNLSQLVNDFEYVRGTLKEVTDNSRRVLMKLSLKITESLDTISDDEDVKYNSSPDMIKAYSALNKVIADNTKTYIYSYKEISNALLSIHKIQSNNMEGPKSITSNTTNTTNNMNIINSDDTSGASGGLSLSTSDLISQMSSIASKNVN